MAPEKHQAKHRLPQGILSPVAQAAAMAAAIAIFLLVAAASTALLLVLVAAARASRRHRGSRYCVPASPPPPPHHADLRRLSSFAFPSSSPRESDGDDGDGDESPCFCAVCLEDARAGERWRAMPACQHAFHAACVDTWLARSPACPLCRAAVTTAATS